MDKLDRLLELAMKLIEDPGDRHTIIEIHGKRRTLNELLVMRRNGGLSKWNKESDEEELQKLVIVYKNK